MRRRIKLSFFMILYCIGTLLVLDLIYSNFFPHENYRPAGIRNARYSHGFAANYEGFDRWGPLYHRFYTNSLGFKDGMVRSVPAKTDVHRILLRGGVFMYPKDCKLPLKAGRLRLLYEANPMSFIVEQAGGKSSTGRKSILDLQ